MLSKITLTGCKIICSEVVTADFALSASDFIFVKGFVYSPNGEPLANAAVEIILIDYSTNPPSEKTLGVTFTVSDGSYGISLPRVTGKAYKLMAYSPG